MNYEESIKYLRDNSHSAYEIYKATGLSEAGLRRVLKGEITNPQRKTKELLIQYTQNIIDSQSDANFITDEFEEAIRYLKRKSHSAYEIHKATGLNESSLRKLLKGKIKPQRKTKEVLIDYVNQLVTPRESNIITDELTLHQINLDQHDLLEDIIRRGVITERLTEIIIDNQEKLLLNSNYKNWFELQVYKKALEVMTNNKV